MDALFNLINQPLSIVLRLFSEWFGHSFAAAVAVFTLLINVVMLPLSIKSQKSSVQQMRLKPKLDELKKKYGDDKQKMAQAQQKLYQDEGVKMSGGCLPMILRLVIMMSIYWLILSPLTYMANADKADVQAVSSAISTKLDNMKNDEKSKNTYNEITKQLSWNNRSSSNQLAVIKFIRTPELKDKIFTEEEFKKIEKEYNRIVAKDNETKIDYLLFGIKDLDLTDTPKWSLDFSNIQLIWIIPFGAFLSQILTSLISMAIQKKNNPEAPNMALMMLTMPLLTLFIGFSLPGGVGFYWICSSLIGGLMQAAIQFFYGPNQMLAHERAKELKKQLDLEKKQMEKTQKSVLNGEE